nr:DUF317 domain-containing protein [Streptomyces acidiscabies]
MNNPHTTTGAPDDGRLVAPAWLAGGGDPLWITATLRLARHWRAAPATLSPHVRLVHPARVAELLLDPEPDGQRWTLLHHAAKRPAWYAQFGARTPVEFIAGLTDRLTARQPDHTLLADPLDLLLAAGWAGTGHDSAVSPDGIARAERYNGYWTVTAAVGKDPENLVWNARLSEHIPSHLVCGFFRALTDPTPLHRNRAALPRRFTSRIRTSPAPAGTHTAQDRLEQRLQDLTTPHQHGPASPAPKPPPRHTR